LQGHAARGVAIDSTALRDVDWADPNVGTVSAASFSVRVDRVEEARRIAFTQFGRTIELESSGVWILVSAEVRASRTTMQVPATTLIGASGRLYLELQRAGDAPAILSAKTVQPGLPTNGVIVFELPEDEVRGLQLVLSEQYDPQLKDEIHASLDDNNDAPGQGLEIAKNGI